MEETRNSFEMVREFAGFSPRLQVIDTPSMPGIHSGLGVVEGWRGSIVHRVELDDIGVVSRCCIVDPSFFNWPAISTSLTDTIVPDFPLANKSFNLSYAGERPLTSFQAENASSMLVDQYSLRST